jgi:hypothetical protein
MSHIYHTPHAQRSKAEHWTDNEQQVSYCKAANALEFLNVVEGGGAAFALHKSIVYLVAG